MNRVLLGIGGLLVGLLALLFAAPAMIDWNRYRGIFEEEASRFLGREVRVGGAVNLRLLPVPFVRFEQVRIADTSANVGRPLFMADDFTVWLSIGALLSGGIEASAIELRKPVVTLVLDGQGGGSWSSLDPERLQGRFVPARVAFDSVRITNGSLAILSPDGQPKAAFENINGELSAQALQGPYRVTAAYAVGGAARELRLSTAKAADDGSVRFKGTVRDPVSGISSSLDGTARDVLRDIKVTGEVTARLPLPANLALPPGDKPADPATGRKPGGEFDVRAALTGDTTGYTLTDLALSFEQGGRPQLATGGARVNWSLATDVELTLNSHWLDLDMIAGAETGAPPLELMQGVAASISRVLATEGRTRATLVIDQAALGGDVVSNLAVSLEKSDGRLGIRSLSAALPGGTRLSASGDFTGDRNDGRFRGKINLRGASLARFTTWAGRGQALTLPARDGPFAVIGDAALGAREVSVRNLSLESGRNLLTGEASWKAGKPQQLTFNLEGSEIDITPFVPGAADPAVAIKDLIAGLAGAHRDRPKPAATEADADIRLRVDRLIVGSAIFDNAVTEFKIAAGNLTVPAFKLSSRDGYALEIQGDIADLARPGAKGSLTGLGVATTPGGAVALAKVLGLPADLVPTEASANFVAPLRLAGRLQVGTRGPDTHDIFVDGTLAASRVSGSVRLGAPSPAGSQTATWRDRPTDIAVKLEGGKSVRLLARAAGWNLEAQPAPPQSSPSTADKTPAEFVFRGIGSPGTGLTTLAAMEGVGIKTEYRGTMKVDDAGAWGIDGRVNIAQLDLARSASLLGLPPRPSLAGPVAGTVRIERKAGTTKLAFEALQLPGAKASGALNLDQAADGHRITGDLKLDRAGLPGLMATLSAAPTSRAESNQRSPWSEAPLDLGGLDELTGSRISVTADTLVLAPGIALADARLEMSVQTGGLEIQLVDAKGLGGKASGRLTLDKAAAGARLAIEVGLAGARLETIATAAGAGSQSVARGVASAMIKMDGTALSSRGLAVALNGSGELVLGQARFNRWTPAAVGIAAESVLALQGEIPPDALAQSLRDAIKAAGIGIGTQKLNLTIADGTVRTAPLVVNAPLGRLTGRAAIDLDQVHLDADLRIEPRNTPQPRDVPQRPELPGIAIVYAGPIAALADLEPRMDFEALSREVAVRKVEREVAELERLRRLDEERVRNESARQAADRIENERRLNERLRLEALGQSLTEPPALAPRPGAAGQQGTATPPADASALQPPATQGQADPSQGGEQTPSATSAQPSPAVESAPAPQPAQGPASAPAPTTAQAPTASKASRRPDPFAPLRNGSP